MNTVPGVEQQFHDVLTDILAQDGAQSLLEMIQHLHAAGLPFQVRGIRRKRYALS